MNLTRLICLASVLSGCTVPQVEKPLPPPPPAIPSSARANPANLVGRASSPAADVEKDLTRGAKHREYHVEALALTAPLSDAHAKARGARRMDPPAKIEAAAVSDMRQAGKLTCFTVTLRTSTIDTAMLSRYLFKLEDHAGALQDVKWATSASVIPRPIGTGMHNWNNSGVACSGKPVDVTKRFTLHVIPEFSTWPKTALVWE